MEELLELRRCVATALGRDQFLHRVLDDAVESQSEAAHRRALAEFARQPGDVQRRVQAAGGRTVL